MPVATSRLAPLAVAAMLALSGCGAFGPGETETDTLTPVSVPSPERTALDTVAATPTPSVASAGLTAGAVSRLVATYDRRLQDGSYRLRITQQLRVDDRVVVAGTLTRQVGADGRSYIEHLNRTGENLGGRTISHTKFYNGTVAATRITNGATPTYVFSPDPRPPEFLSGREQLEGLLRAFVLERRSIASGTEPDVFVGDRIRNPRALATLGTVADPRNGTLVLRLFQNGTAALRANYVVTFEGMRGEVTRTLRVGRVGDVSVSAPSWLETARAQ